MTAEDSRLASQAICTAADNASHEWQRAAVNLNCPFVRMRPKVFIDGDQWCALYGEDLQNGVCAFGDSPAAAEMAFDAAWYEKLSSKKGGG